MSKGQCQFHKCEDYMTLTSTIGLLHERNMYVHVVASELKDPICDSDECQIGSFSDDVYVCHDYVDYLVIDQLHILA